MGLLFYNLNIVQPTVNKSIDRYTNLKHANLLRQVKSAYAFKYNTISRLQYFFFLCKTSPLARDNN